MSSLYERNSSINQNIKRNIVSLIKSEDLFDDLYGEEENKHNKFIAQAIEARIKPSAPIDLISRGFHYTTSIEYPFQPENYLATRYGDGTYGCWYGALELETTIYETAYHALKDVLASEGITEIISRERAIYNVFCNGILIDLRGKEQYYPQLTMEDYSFTQQMGKRIAHEGHPGLLAPSVRKRGGVNVVIFNKKILNQPKLTNYLIYYINPNKRSVSIAKSNGDIFLDLSF